MSSLCLRFMKTIEELELEKSIKCSSNISGNDITKYHLEEKEKRHDLCIRINYELWLNILNYNKSCK